MLDPPEKSLRILYLVTHFGFVRNFDSVIRLLLERGHQVQMGFDTHKHEDDERLVRSIASEYPNLDFHVLPKRGKDHWYALSWSLRLLADWLRFLEPPFAGAPRLRERAGEPIPPILKRAFSLPGLRCAPVVRLARRTVSAVERLLPVPSDVERLGGHAYDIALLTPLVTFGSIQVDYVRWARRRGLPTAALVASWDNLTTKGLMHEVPDSVFVWNKHQVREAVELHDADSAQVIATGASAYDQWFGRAPGATRRELCERVGLDPERPYILYVCSSSFIAPGEAEFVARYVRRLREERALGLHEVGVLVRPHPVTAGDEARGHLTKLSGMDQVNVWPAHGTSPTTEQRRADYFDSIYHSAAVVGINTSALVEGAVVGRPVHTLLTEQFRGTQDGTLHFRYLLPEHGGPLQVGRSWAEHGAQLASSLADDPSPELQERFVRSFVRPPGGELPPTEKLVAEIEAAAGRPVHASWSRTVAARVARPALSLLARVAHVEFQHRGHVKTGEEAPPRLRLLLRRAPRSASHQGAFKRWVAQSLLLPVKLSLRWRPARMTARRLAVPAFGGRGKRLEEFAILEERRQTGDLTKPKAAHSERPARPRLDPIKELAAEIDTLAIGGRTIIAGPWTGPADLELLAWIPLLRGAVERHPGLDERLVAVSRGEVAAWYEGIARRYVDASELYAIPSRLAVSLGVEPSLGGPRALDPTPLERELMDGARRRIDNSDSVPLHASVLRRSLHRGRKAGKLPALEKMLRLRAVRAPDDRDPSLPTPYVVFGAFFNEGLPEREATRRNLVDTAGRLARSHDVVLIDDGINRPAVCGDGIAADETTGARRGRLIDASDLAASSTLAGRTALLAGAEAFYGPFGGLSVLASIVGTDATALVSDEKALDEWILAVAKRRLVGPDLGHHRVENPKSGPPVSGTAEATLVAED